MVDFMLKKPQDIINFWLAYKCDAINIHAIKNGALIITTKGQGSVFRTLKWNSGVRYHPRCT